MTRARLAFTGVLLAGREDFLHEIGQSNVVLGRALLERGRLAEAEECFKAADSAFEQLGSVSRSLIQQAHCPVFLVG